MFNHNTTAIIDGLDPTTLTPDLNETVALQVAICALGSDAPRDAGYAPATAPHPGFMLLLALDPAALPAVWAPAADPDNLPFYAFPWAV
ncbi:MULTISPECIES: hypothetical protein [Nocardia]|uniref:hypothetical protein n=1 Tax=Nocardia TaxID=1817 RepID=UPI002457EAC3|nr:MULTISPECIES: hypothetical protein [Nocardia]